MDGKTVGACRPSLSSDDSEAPGERTYTTKHGTTATRNMSGQKESGKAVLGMLADFGDWSDSRIARHVGVSDKTVAAYRPSIIGNSEDGPATRTVERNGKTYTQDTAGQKKAGKEKAAAAAGFSAQRA